MLKRMMVAMFLLVISTDLVATKEPIAIGDRAMAIDATVSCERRSWGNDAKNSCQCCITKHTLKGDGPSFTINRCAAKKHCNAEALRGLATEIGASVSRVEALVGKVTGASLIAKRLRMPKLVRGQLEVAQVPIFLNAAKNAGLFKQSIDPRCLRVAESKGGWHTKSLFLISTSPRCERGDMGPYDDFHTAYVLKGLTDPQGEILNLHFVKSSDLFTRMKGFADAFPYITMHEFAAGYAVHGKRYYFVMLEAARGKSLLELTRDAARALKANDMDARAVAYLESLETIKTAYNRLGFKMANLHMSYMEPKGAIFGETVVHGDLHHENVFYDKKTNTVSLIDNESFAPSLLGKLASPGQDIVRIYFFGAAILDTSLRFAKEIADDVWAQVTLKPFLEGYVSAYPLGRRKELKAELLKILATPNALQILLKYSAGKPQVYDPIRVALFQSRYVMPIINAL